MKQEKNSSQVKAEVATLKEENRCLRKQIEEMELLIDKANSQLQKGNIPNVVGSELSSELKNTQQEKKADQKKMFSENREWALKAYEHDLEKTFKSLLSEYLIEQVSMEGMVDRLHGTIVYHADKSKWMETLYAMRNNNKS
jgi:hypothetical protein